MTKSIFFISFFFLVVPLQGMEVKTLKETAVDDLISGFMADPRCFVESLRSERLLEVSVLKRHEDLRKIRYSLPIQTTTIACPGRAQISAAGDKVFSIVEGNVLITDLRLNTIVTLEGHEGSVTSVSADLIGVVCVTGSLDTTARVWSTTTGKCIRELSHDAEVKKVLISEQALWLLTVTQDDYIHLWDLESGIEIITKEVKGAVDGQVLLSRTGDQIVVATADYDLHIITGENSIILEDVHADTIVSLAYDYSQRMFVTASLDGTSCVWDVDGVCIGTLKGHGAAVVSARFDSKGMVVVTASEDATAKVWEVTGKCLRTFKGHTDTLTDARFNDEGDRVITSSKDQTARIWCARTGEFLVPLEGHEAEVYKAGFIGKRAYTLSKDGKGIFWEVDGIITVLDSLSVEQLLLVGAIMRHMREIKLFRELTCEEVLTDGLLLREVVKPFDLSQNKVLQVQYERLPREVKEMFDPFVHQGRSHILQVLNALKDSCCGAKRRMYLFE